MNFEKLLKYLKENNITPVLENNDIQFIGPDNVLTDEIKEKLTRYRLKLIEKLKNEAKLTTEKIMPIKHSAEGERLSWYQERLWVFYQLNKKDLSYNVPIVFLIEGKLDGKALEKSLDSIIERHGSLRTRFSVNNQGEVRQHIDPHKEFKLPVVSCNEDEIENHIEENASHVFDLMKGPIFIAKLIKLETKKHLLLVNVHHIVSDGWSMVGVFLKELYIYYSAYSTGSNPLIQPLTIQYTDFSRWQRSIDFASNIDYWKNHLKGYEDSLELPTSYLRQPRSGKESETFTYQYPKSFSSALDKFSKEHQCSLFMSLLGAFALTVSNYTSKTDLCIGTTAAGRSKVELEPLIGFLVNILPLRIAINEDDSVSEYIEKVRKITLDGFDNQMVPFEQILYSTKNKQSNKQNALVPLILRHHNFPHAKLDQSLPDGVKFTPYTGDDGDEANKTSIVVAARCELEISYIGDGNELEAEIVFASDLYTRKQIETLMAHHEQVLLSFFQDDNQSLQNISPLRKEDIDQLTVEFNRTEKPLENPALFTDRFDVQADKTPKSIACYDHEGEWSYRKIADSSNRLAHGLIKQGVSPGDIVGVYMDKGASLLITLLAIWKAGAAYVPLDPSYPNTYLNQIINDANPSCMVTISEYQKKMGLDEKKCFLLDKSVSKLESFSVKSPGVIQDGENTAYLMYTSGSTGKPKGVFVPHKQLINWLNGIEANWPFEDGEVVGQKTTFAFAVSVKEIFAGLLNGCPQIFIPSKVLADAGAFIDMINQYKVSRLNLVPSHLKMVLSYLRQNDKQLPSLKYCITAGEPLTAELVNDFRKVIPHAKLLNNYGCTELNDICYYDTENFKGDQGFVPIGRPIQNSKIYLFDRQQRLVPQGVAGELYVASVGMSKGYNNLPELTKERFLKNPYGKPPYDVFYNTGDVVKWLPDGNLEFIGRWDFQVKIRGFRVDVRQVEKVLGDYQGIGTRAVVGAGEKLLAFYQSDSGEDIEISSLRSFLESRLPNYMVPDSYILLDSFPKLPNGKMNRRALLDYKGDVQAADKHEEPATDLEKAMAEIWAEVLEVSLDKIGLNTHFFEIGGHSLAAMRVIARIKDRFNVEINLSQIFEQKRLKSFCEYISSFVQIENFEKNVWTLKEKEQETKTVKTKLLEGKAALITGDCNDISISIAQTLADNGAKIALNYQKNKLAAQNVKKQIEGRGGIAEIFKADVMDMEAVQKMKNDIDDCFGSIDILVANAAVGFQKHRFVDYKWDEFEKKVSEELKAVFYPCQAIVPQMVEQKSGNIIVISHVMSKKAYEGYVAHSTAKASLDAFVRSLAKELGPDGIRINTVAPGLILYDVTTNLPIEEIMVSAKMSPLGRNGLPDDVAGAVLFLASDLSGFMTGGYLPVDGGATML